MAPWLVVPTKYNRPTQTGENVTGQSNEFLANIVYHCSMPFSRPSPDALPLIQLSLALPLAVELEDRGISAAPVLSGYNLNMDMLKNADAFIPAARLYQLVDDLATASGDPYFGAVTGQKQDLEAWLEAAKVSTGPATLGNFITRFILGTVSIQSSVNYRLVTTANRALLTVTRKNSRHHSTKHVDGYGLAIWLGIISRVAGNEWNGSRVVAQIHYPEAIPKQLFDVRLGLSQRDGLEIAFPVEWLLLRTDSSGSPDEFLAQDWSPVNETSLLESIRETVGPHISDPDLDTEAIATLCGLSPRTLSRRLKQRGTSIHKFLTQMRMEKAIELLEQTDEPIRAISSHVGFRHPTAFTRAFKQWSGKKPTETRSIAQQESK